MFANRTFKIFFVINLFTISFSKNSPSFSLLTLCVKVICKICQTFVVVLYLDHCLVIFILSDSYLPNFRSIKEEK